MGTGGDSAAAPRAGGTAWGSGVEGSQVPEPAAPWLTPPPATGILLGAMHSPRNGIRRDLCGGGTQPGSALALPRALNPLGGLGASGDGCRGGWGAALPEASAGCPLGTSAPSLRVTGPQRKETGGGIALPAHPPARTLPRRGSPRSGCCRAGGKGLGWGGSGPPKPPRASGCHRHHLPAGVFWGVQAGTWRLNLAADLLDQLWGLSREQVLLPPSGRRESSFHKCAVSVNFYD